MFNTVMIVPTGIGAAIGGHAGDANPAAKLLASVSDHLITHPNVVNASDINEMTDNTLYVEGSILDRFLKSSIDLKKVNSNKILLAVNEVTTEIVNSVSAARATIGAQIEIVELHKPLEMIATMEDKQAKGIVNGYLPLVEQVKGYDFDALAIATPIKSSASVALKYLKHGGINPWGGVEAMASSLIACRLGKPVAHSPVDDKESETYKGMEKVATVGDPVDPRMAAELVSVCYLHCILKGLHRAPRIVMNSGEGDLNVSDVNVLVSPHGCWSGPHFACVTNRIPIIVVRENKTSLEYRKADLFHVNKYCTFVDTYLEAVGVIQAMKIGVSLESVRRPLSATKVYRK